MKRRRRRRRRRLDRRAGLLVLALLLASREPGEVARTLGCLSRLNAAGVNAPLAVRLNHFGSLMLQEVNFWRKINEDTGRLAVIYC